jgi:dipicolinate synthase subunit A
MKDEKIVILNAIATAEGTIMEAIRSSDQNLHGSNCIELGYGRCAKVLAQKLKALMPLLLWLPETEKPWLCHCFRS